MILALLLYSAIFHIFFCGVEHTYPRVFPYRNKVVIYSKSIMNLRYYILYFTLYAGFLGGISLIMSKEPNTQYWLRIITFIAFFFYVYARFELFPRRAYIKKQLDKILSKSTTYRCDILWKQDCGEFGPVYSPSFCHPGKNGKEEKINEFYYDDFFECKGDMELICDNTAPEKWYARIIEPANPNDVETSCA